MKIFFQRSIKQKLVMGFLLIVVSNALVGVYGVFNNKMLGKLVQKTYDNALMSGTFALAAKYDFSELKSEFQQALAARSEKAFNLHLKRAKKLLATLKEDLDIYRERSLANTHQSQLIGVLGLLPEMERELNHIAEIKRAELKKMKLSTSPDLINDWGNNPELKQISKGLTKLYDNAAEDGYAFRLEAEDRVAESLTATTWVLSLSFIISIFLAIFLSLIIIRPLSGLTQVCKKIADGVFGNRAQIKTKDEFGTLASSFNLMLDKIEEKTESMSSLLSSIPFALFYFDEQGNISAERSLATDKFFSEFARLRTINDFFQTYSGDCSKVADIRTAMFKKLLPFSSAAFLLPQVVLVGDRESGRMLQLSYRPKYDGLKMLEKVIVMGEDITEKEKTKLKNSDLMERVERISKVSADLQGFKEFLETVRKMLLHTGQSIESRHYDRFVDIKRDLHSIKGMLGIYSFSKVARMVHELEDFLGTDPRALGEDALQRIKAINAAFFAQTDDLVQLLALNLDNNLRIYDEAKINQLRGLIRQLGEKRLQTLVEDLDRFPLHRVFAKYSLFAKDLLKTMQDKQVSIEFGDSDEVSYEEVQRLDSVIIHLLNNSIDHGIESSLEREQAKKAAVGVIRISCVRNTDNSLILRLSDDGKGIDGDYLLEKAIKTGLVAPETVLSQEDKNQLIFMSGLSSRSETSIVSGRGIGMDAVKAQIEAIGGAIRLSTIRGIGTSFELLVPPFLRTT